MYGDVVFVTVPLSSWDKTAGIGFSALSAVISIPVPFTILARVRKMCDLHDLLCTLGCDETKGVNTRMYFWNAFKFAARLHPV